MRKQMIRFALIMAMLASTLMLGMTSVNAAAVTIPSSGVTATYDLAEGSVVINGDGTYVINQSNSSQATANTISITQSSSAKVYLNGVNILVPPSPDGFSPIEIDASFMVNLYLVDGTENILDSGNERVNTAGSEYVDSGSGQPGIKVPWGTTLNIYGDSGSLEAHGAVGYNYLYGYAHGGGGAGIGGRGGYRYSEGIIYAPQYAGYVKIYGGTVKATGGKAGGYWGGGGHGIGGGGATLDSPAMGTGREVALYGGSLTATGGNSATATKPSGYGIGADLYFEGGSLIAKTSANLPNSALYSNPGISSAIPTYTWRTSASGSYAIYPETAYTYSTTQTYVEIVTQIDTSAPVLTAGAVSRTSDTQGTVKFTSNESGTYYYAVVADGASAPTIDTSGAGTSCTTAETTITDPTGLTAGEKDIYIVVKDLGGNVSEALKLDIPAYVRQVSSWAELKTAVQNAPTGEAEIIIEITQSFSTDWIYGTIYDWSSGGVGKNITIQSAAGGPYTITRGANHLTSFFANDYDLGTLTLKNIILDGNGSNITASKAMFYKAGGTWILESGAKLQNIKANVGGGYAAGVQNQGGTFIMKEGSSIVNAVNTADYNTGGIRNIGTFIMEGGSITGCIGHGYGGVYSTGPLTVSGNITITGNEKSSGSDSDLTLYTASGIVNIAAAGLHADARIGIANLSVPYTITGSSSQDYSGNFFSNWPLAYTIVNTGTGEAQVVKLVSNTAFYTVEHYLENLAGDGYTLMEEETENKSGTLGSSVTASALTFTGFSENTSHEDRVASGILTYGVSTVLKLYYTRNAYPVTFLDHDGYTLKEESVKYEGNATAPADPTRPGYTFSGWDDGYTGVTAALTVNATYTVNTDTPYKVEHYKENLDGSYTKCETEEKTGTTDTTATALAKTYTGFTENTSHADRVASASISGNGSMVLKLYYERNTHTVIFQDYDKTELKTQSVKYGGDATAPAAPVREGYLFDRWDTDYTEVTGNLTVTALYNKLNNPVLDILEGEDGLEVEAEGLDGAVGFSNEERLNEDISIRLEVSLLDEDTVPKGDKDLLDAYSGETLKLSAVKMLLLDISLFKVVGETETEVTNADQEITIRFILPEEYRNQDFRIARVHEGKVEILEHTYDKDTFEVTFRTDKFSTYGLVFQPAATVTVLPKTGSSPGAAGIILIAGLVLVSLGHGVMKKESENQD